jgi:tetratricopeptide (TPR) repeat protein
MPADEGASTMRALIAVFACLLLVASAAQGEPLDHEHAIRALADVDATVRRDAADRLGDIGTMADMTLLVRTLRDPDDETRARAEQAMWRIWARSGDAEIDRLYQTGVEQMSAGELADSIATFSRIIERKPDFAEGWNKRATVYFLAGEMRKSLADCDEVMKRNPYHFGALSGYVMIYVRLGYFERALEYSRRALDVNPNLAGVRQNMELIERALEERRSRTI